jgi:taurine dioxygenase
MQTMSEAKLAITSLDPVGGEVRGLCDRPITPEIAETLRKGWLEYGILVFHDIDTIERHLEVSRCFGELEMHPAAEFRSKEHPFLVSLGGADTPAHVFDERELRLNRIAWHRDTAFVPDVCHGAMLRMVQIPDSDGETLLADTAAAYDDLPASVKAQLDGLECRAGMKLSIQDWGRGSKWWKTVRRARDDEYPEGTKPVGVMTVPDIGTYPAVVMPATIVHPHTGRRCIFISPMNIEHFLGMPPAESDDLIDFLCAHITSPRYVYKHHWRANDAIIWDNWRFLHAAVGNMPCKNRRYGLRTNLASKMRDVGRLAKSTVEVAG